MGDWSPWQGDGSHWQWERNASMKTEWVKGEAKTKSKKKKLNVQKEEEDEK